MGWREQHARLVSANGGCFGYSGCSDPVDSRSHGTSSQSSQNSQHPERLRLVESASRKETEQPKQAEQPALPAPVHAPRSPEQPKQTEQPALATLRTQAAELIRRSGVEGLDVDDLGPVTLRNLTWYGEQAAAPMRGVRVWLKAIRAAKHTPLGIDVDATRDPVLIGWARQGGRTGLLEVDACRFDLAALLELVMQGGQQEGKSPGP